MDPQQQTNESKAGGRISENRGVVLNIYFYIPSADYNWLQISVFWLLMDSVSEAKQNVKFGKSFIFLSGGWSIRSFTSVLIIYWIFKVESCIQNVKLKYISIVNKKYLKYQQ